MVVEVYSQLKPPVGRRAVLAAAVLLLLTLLLAFSLTRRRAVPPVRARIEPAGWSISFDAPSRYYQEGRTDSGYAFSFVDRLRDSSPVAISVHRLQPHPGESEAQIADQLALAVAPQYRDFVGVAPLYWFGRRLGPFEAVQLWEPRLNLVVRATRMDGSGEGYAVAIQAAEPLDADLMARFESVCESVRRR